MERPHPAVVLSIAALFAFLGFALGVRFVTPAPAPAPCACDFAVQGEAEIVTSRNGMVACIPLAIDTLGTSPRVSRRK